MSGNGLLAGLVAITAPSGFVNPTGSAIIGLVAGVLVCFSVAFVENHAQGRRSGRRHLRPRNLRSVGRALRRSVCRRHQQLWRIMERRHRLGHRPLLRRRQPVGGAVGRHRHAGRLRLHLQLSCSTGFWTSFIGQRVSTETEVAGLDLPEMGQLGYPEFVFRPEPDVLAAAEQAAVA